MKHWCSLLSFSVLSVVSMGRAFAEEAAPVRERVFDDVVFEEPRAQKKMIELELKSLQSKCSFQNVFSREGPPAWEVRACEAAVAVVARRGSSAISGILRVLDQDGTSFQTRRRLYDVLARTKDARLIEPLVRGMARIATRNLSRREWELSALEDALAELSQSSVHEALPGVGQARQVSQRRRALDVVVDYRLWLDDNAGLSYEELVEKRTADELAHVNDENVERAYRAILYLLKRKNAVGIEAGAKFGEREDVPDGLKRVLAYRLLEAKKAPVVSKGVKNQAPKPKSSPVAPVKKVPASKDVDLASRARS